MKFWFEKQFGLWGPGLRFYCLKFILFHLDFVLKFYFNLVFYCLRLEICASLCFWALSQISILHFSDFKIFTLYFYFQSFIFKFLVSDFKIWFQSICFALFLISEFRAILSLHMQIRLSKQICNNSINHQIQISLTITATFTNSNLKYI